MPATATPDHKTETDTFLDQPWEVVVHNDPVNLMSYVAHIIRKIFGYGEKEAERLMMQVHKDGRSIVWSGGREKAEHYVRELHASQLLATLQKSD